MRRPLLLMAIAGLAACSEKAERTYTADELVADEALLSGLITTCRNNPGERSETTNCRNAERAAFKMRLQLMQRH